MLLESSLNELYRSTVEAFPNTTKRQHATDTIQITNLQWTPFLGMKTLMVKGLTQNEGREYTPLIVFKNVLYHPTRDEYGLIQIRDITGAQYLLERLSAEENDVLVRCNCKDFYWRFNYTDHLSHDLAGRKRQRYEALHNPGSSNPSNAKGMCKHLMVLTHSLGDIIT